MSILGFLPLIGKITEKVTDIIGEKVEDKDLANELKAEIKQQILINDHEENLELIIVDINLENAQKLAQNHINATVIEFNIFDIDF